MNARQTIEPLHISHTIPSPYELVLSGDYFCQLAASIESAHERVSIVTLLIGLDSETAPVFRALKRATLRGVHITLVADRSYSRGYYFFQRGCYLRTMRALHELKLLGARVEFRGETDLDPFRRRCHAKIAVIDNTAFAFGGVNLAGKAARNADFMFKVAHTDIANHLDSVVSALASKQQLDDCFSSRSSARVLVDWGVPDKSEIYEEACRIVETATAVHYVSQFCPTGRLARLLRATDTTYYFNRSLSWNLPLGAMLSFDKLTSGARTSYRQKRYLHAKLIVAYYADGSAAVLAGSHNFKFQGVRNGTVEVAFSTREPAVRALIGEFLQQVS